MRLKPTQQTIYKLILLSGNRCAFPGCNEALVNEHGALIGEVCHIEAAMPGGERYNATMTDEERRHLSNLVLFCANHHRVTDDVDIYTVDTLKEIKRSHEEGERTHPYDASQGVIDQIAAQFEQALSQNHNTDDIVSDAEHQAALAKIQNDFTYQARGAQIRFGGSSAVDAATSAYQRMASQKRADQMRRKAKSDAMFDLDLEEINETFDEQTAAVRAEMNRRGLPGSGIEQAELQKVEKRRERAIARLRVRYGRQ